MNTHRPFSGIKVLALVKVIAAPFAAYQLALHGADVIRVEDNDVPDTRRTSGGKNLGLTAKGMGTAFMAHASNTRSISLNLRTEEGKEIFRKLVAGADVLVENFRVGTMAKLGLGYESLKEINPRLVYCALTGFGQTGPFSRLPATDSYIQAVSGFMSLNGTEESGPVKAASHVFDYSSGYAAALGIVTALFQRERTGQGQYIDVSMLETAVIMMSTLASDFLNAGIVPKRLGNRSDTGVAANLSIVNVFRCRDDTQLFIGASRQHQQERMWQAIGLRDLPQDPRFATVESRRENIDDLYAEIGKALLSRTAAEWEELLTTLDVPATRINSLPEALSHPQITSRGLIRDLGPIPDLGINLKVPVASYWLSDGTARIDSPPPRMGQDTDAILRELGYENDDIETLRVRRIV